MSSKEFLGLVVGRKNREIYEVLPDDTYKNLSSGKMGRLKLEDAQRLFNIPITLNLFAERNPLIVDLIEKLGMSLEPYTEEEKNIFLENAMKNLDGN